MAKELLTRLKEYIHDELSDSKYYIQLAQRAPDEMQKDLLQEFAADEKEHAAVFIKAVEKMTGRKYMMPIIEPPTLPESYTKALQTRVINESGDFRKYGEEYLDAPNTMLKNAFYRARTDENVHALRLLDILSMQNEL